MFKKAKLYSLLAIIVASTVIGLFSTAQNANAQTSTGAISVYIDPGLEKDVKTKIWRGAMLSCIRAHAGFGNERSFKDLKSGKWFEKDQGKNVGFLIEPEDGRYRCTEASFVTGFSSYFGWESPFLAACQLEIFNVSWEDCLAGETSDPQKDDYEYNGNAGDMANRAGEVIDYKVDEQLGGYNTNNGNLDEKQLYVLYMRTFQIACATGSPSTSAPGPGEISTHPHVIAVDGHGNPVDVYYPIPDNDDKKSTRWVAVNGSDDDGGGNEEKTCLEIAEAINENAPAYATWVADQHLSDEQIALGTGLPHTSGGDGNGTSTCQISGIGWLVCPVFSFLAVVSDQAYKILELFLKLPPVNMTLDETNGTYTAWKIMRDFANILFVIAFLIIVFSQITGAGISNYGLKRLLPKLIVAAILVNTSYFLCAVAVDLSNILGTSIKAILDGIALRIVPPENASAFNDGNTYTNIVAASLLVGIGVGAAAGGVITLPLVGAALLFILPTLIAVLVMMIARQAAVVLLIFISPLAFVALLLPNTEDYFKRWRQLFKAMLLIYPIVALAFGAGTLASAVLTAAGGDANNPLETVHGIAAAAVRILPLLMIPTLMKITSGVFGKFTGIVNDKQKGAIDGKRNSLMDGHKYNKAQKIAKTGRFVNPTITDPTTGKPIADPGAGGVFGKSGSRRRRAVGYLTPLRGVTSEAERKDKVSQTDSLLEQTYLNSPTGQEARGATKNAQVSVQNAQINVETIRLESDEGKALQKATTTAETVKHSAETEAKTLAIAALPHELEEREKLAETKMKAAEEHATSVGFTGMANSTAGQDALKELENQKNARVEAEKKASTIGISGADRDAAARAEEATLKMTSAESDLAREVAPKVDQATRVAAKQAELTKQTAVSEEETKATKTFNSDPAAQAALGASKNAELTKEMADNESKSLGIANANEEFKVQAQSSTEALSTQQNEDRQLYEEIAAVGDAHPNIAALGIDPNIANAARDTRQQKKAVDRATSSAAYEGEMAYAKRIQDEAKAREVAISSGASTVGVSPLLDQAGGNIKPDAGRSRATSQAQSTLSASFGKTVSEFKDAMTEFDAAKLKTIYTDDARSAEERSAAIGLTYNVGGEDDIEEAINYIATNDTSWSPQKLETVKAMRQQTRSDIGNRKPIAIGASAMSRLAVGAELGTDVNGLLLDRLIRGKITAESVAQSPKEYAEKIELMARTNPTLAGDDSFKKLQSDMIKLLTNPVNYGKYASEVTDIMKVIAPAPSAPASPSPTYGPPIPPPVGGRPDDV